MRETLTKSENIFASCYTIIKSEMRTDMIVETSSIFISNLKFNNAIKIIPICC